MKAINLKEKFSLFDDYWSPKIIADLNSHQVKCAKFKGEFTWHQHDVDEMFLVVQGSLKLFVENQDKPVLINQGEMIVIPRKMRHCPVAENEAYVLIIEPNDVVNTGDVQNHHTIEKIPRI
ncbi:MAG: 3-hydroxyanthranilate 3,4-dioxygenase [Chlamydiae bacterium]|nr:3-hydroxyanthranilate 3,4-dioxygenase [Chlamydiota bacterium]